MAVQGNEFEWQKKVFNSDEKLRDDEWTYKFKQMQEVEDFNIGDYNES
jgi:hypothetical protein